MKPTLQLRKQHILYYENGEPEWSSPVVVAQSGDYKFLEKMKKENEQRADEEGKKESVKFWITPAPPVKSSQEQAYAEKGGVE